MPQWIWCFLCERAFIVRLSRKPKWQADDEKEEYGEQPEDFFDELEPHLGMTHPDGTVQLCCSYNDCDGDLTDFVWWENYREMHPEAPVEPVPGIVYPD